MFLTLLISNFDQIYFSTTFLYFLFIFLQNIFLIFYSPSPWEKNAKKYECEMYTQNHVAIEPTNDDAIENDKENNENIRLENMTENSFAFKQENTEDNEPTTKGY